MMNRFQTLLSTSTCATTPSAQRLDCTSTCPQRFCRAFVCFAGDCAKHEYDEFGEPLAVQYHEPLNTVESEEFGEPPAVQCDDCGKWACWSCASRGRRDPTPSIEEHAWTEMDSDDEYGTYNVGRCTVLTVSEPVLKASTILRYQRLKV